LGRAIDERPDWFAVLRSAVAKLDSSRDVLLTAPNTTVDRFLDRAAVLFELRRLRVHFDERHSLVDWLTRLRRQLQRNGAANQVTPEFNDASEAFVSPILADADGLQIADQLRDADGQPAEGSASDERPLSDRVLIAAADQVLALQVRPNGNLHHLLRTRLMDAAWPSASVWLALGDALVPSEVAEELQSLGAVGWWLFADDVPRVRGAGRSGADADEGADAEIVSDLHWRDGDYLVHWTRRRDGPWPGESEAEFLDDLLLSADSVSHSAFAALFRIVQQRRLIASAAGIRDGVAVVSCSANSLRETVQRRTFRAHRGRWDGEAYGLCLRREWLQARGAKPVLYGDDALWETLPPSDQPFFQLKTTRSRGGAQSIDWSQEAEWRVPHDVDLSEAGRDDVVLFVRTAAEAQQLAAISPWPVLVACRDPIHGVERRSTP
jgi:hypothetical protein